MINKKKVLIKCPTIDEQHFLSHYNVCSHWKWRKGSASFSCRIFQPLQLLSPLTVVSRSLAVLLLAFNVHQIKTSMKMAVIKNDARLDCLVKIKGVTVGSFWLFIFCVWNFNERFAFMFFAFDWTLIRLRFYWKWNKELRYKRSCYIGHWLSLLRNICLIDASFSTSNLQN